MFEIRICAENTIDSGFARHSPTAIIAIMATSTAGREQRRSFIDFLCADLLPATGGENGEERQCRREVTHVAGHAAVPIEIGKWLRTRRAGIKKQSANADRRSDWKSLASGRIANPRNGSFEITLSSGVRTTERVRLREAARRVYSQGLDRTVGRRGEHTIHFRSLRPTSRVQGSRRTTPTAAPAINTPRPPSKARRTAGNAILITSPMATRPRAGGG